MGNSTYGCSLRESIVVLALVVVFRQAVQVPVMLVSHPYNVQKMMRHSNASYVSE